MIKGYCEILFDHDVIDMINKKHYLNENSHSSGKQENRKAKEHTDMVTVMINEMNLLVTSTENQLTFERIDLFAKSDTQFKSLLYTLRGYK